MVTYKLPIIKMKHNIIFCVNGSFSFLTTLTGRSMIAKSKTQLSISLARKAAFSLIQPPTVAVSQYL